MITILVYLDLMTYDHYTSDLLTYLVTYYL